MKNSKLFSKPLSLASLSVFALGLAVESQARHTSNHKPLIKEVPIEQQFQGYNCAEIERRTNLLEQKCRSNGFDLSQNAGKLLGTSSNKSELVAEANKCNAATFSFFRKSNWGSRNVKVQALDLHILGGEMCAAGWKDAQDLVKQCKAYNLLGQVQKKKADSTSGAQNDALRGVLATYALGSKGYSQISKAATDTRVSLARFVDPKDATETAASRYSKAEEQIKSFKEVLNQDFIKNAPECKKLKTLGQKTLDAIQGNVKPQIVVLHREAHKFQTVAITAANKNAIAENKARGLASTSVRGPK